MSDLMAILRWTGAHGQAAALAGRLPAVGMFRLFLIRAGRRKGLRIELPAPQGGLF